MAGLGVSVAVIDDAGRILLQQREDFAVWGLPGGEIEAGETAAQAAIREVREETGLDVRLTRLVGLYAMPRWRTGNDHNVVFGAVLVGGELIKRTSETLDAGFFAIDALPEALLPWHRQRIQDALDGKVGMVWQQDATWPFGEGLTRTELYQLRDQSGLSRHEFLRQFIDGFSLDETLEVDGDDGR